ncbi:response regulator [Vibrio sp. SS-MA-C1-2]|uniref:response regulator n=1 Tax=Vibrio sp. SS-MA-C1-2 TaxID=2908646 RepID=UPI001F3AAF73|nr:response regulator [Vibrio sp. SS-MA-C1-2]UJF20005.1 response regulator [Vibrio sp. SS-MA-C1-2]
MNKYLIICIDDEREVLDSVLHDITDLEAHFMLEAAESVAEAREVIIDAQKEGVTLALVLCDHQMPKETGIDFLIELTEKDETKNAQKILLTGQAGLPETITAINNHSIDYFIAKPWNKDELKAVVIEQLTEFVIQHDKNPMTWASTLDTGKILNAISQNRQSLSDY